MEPREMLSRLIAYDTTSRNSNLALIDFVRDYLDRLGVASELVFDDSGAKANLLATIGPQDRPGIVLSGHTDVVPVDGQDWSSDPFRALERDGRVFGRGSADMKGFIATALALVPEFLELRLSEPIHLALSYDEEVGCKGVPRLLDRLAEALPERPRGCVVGEPSGMRAVNGHKGKGGYACVVTGLAAHSALNHRGVNAVEMAAEIVTFVRRMNQEFKARGPFAEGFEPPHATAGTGVIAGGTALNILPDRCRFEFEFRTLPDQDPEALLARVQAFAESELLPEMRRIAPDARFTWTEIMSYPGLGGEQVAEIERVCRELTGTARPQKVSFGTEAGHFARRGIPAVICGPGEIAVAHRPDEYVELEQLDRCASFLRALAQRMVA